MSKIFPTAAVAGQAVLSRRSKKSRFASGLKLGPTAEDEVCTLRGRGLQPILAEEFHVLRSLAGVHHLLQHLGYSYLRPRLVISKLTLLRSKRTGEIGQSGRDRLRLSILESANSTFRMSRGSSDKKPRRVSGHGKDRGRRPCVRPSTSTCGCSAPSVPRRSMPRDSSAPAQYVTHQYFSAVLGHDSCG